ncbi:MAG: radical SAM protein [Candidatus Riflebacteria bacterium]|nr:radical SAM protein [Candidatus Riflebacteria bacterium]
MDENENKRVVKAYRYVFGPVPSRRLGRSLGVDLTPGKICTLNCRYCQLNETLEKTVTRKNLCNHREVAAEIFANIEEINPSPDWITFSGSGEPTLNKDIGKIINSIKVVSEIPVCVITNGTLLSFSDVRNDLMLADRVLPTISSLDEKIFDFIHRPSSELRLKEILEGLRAFSQQYKGFLEIEVFVISGINDDIENAVKIGNFIKTLKKVDAVYLNTAVRPASSSDIKPVSAEGLSEFRRAMGLDIKISTAYEFSAVLGKSETKINRSDLYERIPALLFRHPCTTDQLAATFGVSASMLNEVVRELSDKRRVVLNSDGTWSTIPSSA